MSVQEGTTPQSEPVAVAIPNPDGGVSQPFLINGSTPANTDGNHNDADLRNQRTVINLNNNNVRITIWCIIYIVWTSLSSQINATQLVYWQTDTDNDYDSDTDKELQSLRLFGSFNGILWWAAAMILCNLYCTCCKYNCMKFSAALFVLGGILAAATLGDQMPELCDGSSEDSVEDGYCKVSQYAGYVFPILFSCYMAVDAIWFIGDNIRIRMAVPASLIAVRSFLAFLVYRYDFSKYVDDSDSYNSRYDAAAKYSLQTGMSASFSLFFWCGVILIIVMMGYGDPMNPSKKLNVWLKRIIGWFVIGATGASLFIPYGGYGLITPWWYWLPAACLLAYDVQYL